MNIWTLGISAIEMAEGHPPLDGLHNLRQIFLISHNPPPTLKEPSKWSQHFNNFLHQCLVKEPRKRASLNGLLHVQYIILNESD
jgi:serine/threonine protein kinase